MEATRKRLGVTALVLAAALGMLLATAPAWADDGLAAGGVSELQEQAGAKDYEFEYQEKWDDYYSSPAIEVRGVKSGKVSYNKKTKTLTLSNVKMEGVYLNSSGDGCKKLTINLIGKSSGNECFIDDDGWYNSKGEKTEYCKVTVTGKGTVSGSVRCGDLTLNGGTISVSNYKVDSHFDAVIDCSGNLVLNGGGITLKNCTVDTEWSHGISCNGLTLKKGSISISKCKASDDGAEIVSCSGKLSVLGGALSLKECDGEGVYCGGLELKKGSISISKCKANGGLASTVHCSGKLSVLGGALSLKECDGGGVYCKGMELKKGSITVDDQFSESDEGYSSEPSIHVYGGNLMMSGGVLKVTRSYQKAIVVESYTTGGEKYRGRVTPTVVHGGKIRVTGGNLTAKVNKPSRTVAIKADSMAGKVSLKKIKGFIDAKGLKFKDGGSTYATNGVEDRYNKLVGKAKLVRYKDTSREVNLGAVKLNGLTYEVNAIGAKAFAGKRGAKVRSVVFENDVSTVETNAFYGAKSLRTVTFDEAVSEVQSYAFKGAKRLSEVWFAADFSLNTMKIRSKAFAGSKSLSKIHLGNQLDFEIAANAFAGTKALTTLEFDGSSSSPFSVTYNRRGKFRSVKWSESDSISKKAFANCGKNNGKGLTVTFGENDYDGIPKEREYAYRKLFTSKGMPSGFKLQIYSERTR